MHGLRLAYRSVICVVLLLLLASGARAQHPLYYTLNDENGLPTNEVYELVQDEFGLIWMGVSNGFFHYDGVRLVEVSHPLQKGSTMTGVYPDRRRRIWCQNVSRQVFRVQADSLHLVLDGSAIEGLQHISFSPEGRLYLIKNKVVQCLDEEGALVQEWKLEKLADVPFIIEDAVAREGQLFMMTDLHGLQVLDLKTGEVRQMLETVAEESGGFNFKGEGVYAVTVNSKTHQLRMAEFSGKAFSTFHAETLPPTVRVLRLVPVGEDELMLCTSNGVIPFRRTVQGWVKGVAFLPGQRVSSVLRDSEGITWYPTLSKGIAVVVSDKLKMHKPLEGIASSFTSVLVLPSGGYLIGTTSGDLYHMRDSAAAMTLLPKKGKQLQDYSVKVLRKSPIGILVSRGGVSVMDPVTFQETTLPISNARDLCVAGDTLFGVWSSNFRAYSLASLKEGDPSKFLEISAVGGKALQLDPQTGVLYAALNQGLFFRRHGKLTEILYQGKSINCHIFVGDRDGVWTVCNKVGLLYLQDGEVKRVVGPEAGLPELDFSCATLAGEWIFMGTENYVLRLHIPTGKVVSLSRSIGLKPDGIARMSATATKMWLASSEGILEMPLDFDPSSGVMPNIRIQKMELNGQLVTPDSLLHLPPSGNSLKIYLQGISFRSKGKYAFKYRLKGYDNSWTVMSGASNVVQYPTLPNGDWIFEVKLLDVNGNESTEPAQLKIHVDTPLLMRPYIIALMVLLGFVLAAGIFFLILRIIRRRHLAHQQLLGSQLTALKAQMNPHFMFNALNSIQDLVLSKDIRNSNLYLSKFSRLMRMVLDGSGKNEVRLSDEIEMLKLYLDLEMLRFGSEMECSFEVSESLDTDRLLIPSMVIQPFVENAIKHGLLHRKGPKRLTLTFAPQGEGLHCTIRDNGVGRARAAEIRQRGQMGHTSFSTEATVKRLDLIRDLYAGAVEMRITDLQQDGEPIGTQVDIQLPFMNP